MTELKKLYVFWLHVIRWSPWRSAAARQLAREAAAAGGSHISTRVVTEHTIGVFTMIFISFSHTRVVQDKKKK